MNKIFILLGSIFLATNAQGQITRDLYLAHKQRVNFSGIENPSGQYAGFFRPFEQSASGNNKLKSTSTIKQKLESDRVEIWDEESGKWILYGKGKYTYDEHLNCILYLDSFWDAIHNQWFDYIKTELTYDSMGKITSWVSSSKTGNATTWLFSDKWEYVNDDAGKCILAYSYMWNEYTNEWENIHKEEYTYDSKGNRASMVGTHLHESTNEWIQSEKEEYSYDANGIITGNILFYWSDETSSWVNNERQEYVYDSAGNNIVFSTSYFSIIDSAWIKTIQEENTFDINGNRIVQIQNNWNDLTKIENTYDNNYSFEELILPFPYPVDYYRHMCTTSIVYNYYHSDWVLWEKVKMFYKEVNTSNISGSGDNALYIYPNPASQFVSFEADIPLTNANLILYDMQAREVMTREVENNVPVSIKQLDKGLYLYRIVDDGIKYNGKLIIQ